VQADFADSRDSLHLPRLVEQLQARLSRHDLSLQDLVADTGYSLTTPFSNNAVFRPGFRCLRRTNPR
jgi:hypothetical protein